MDDVNEIFQNDGYRNFKVVIYFKSDSILHFFIDDGVVCEYFHREYTALCAGSNFFSLIGWKTHY